jgi:hypothetical protein
LDGIVWPAQFDPKRAPVHVTNAIESRASAAAVWAWLVRASQWSQWYPNASDVVLPNGARELSAGMRFRWCTFGVRLVSRVEEWGPEARIAWTARGIGVWAYHAWLIEPRAGGSRILTEETQYGLLARLGGLLMPGRMQRGHQLWLEGLDRVAQSGPPVWGDPDQLLR